MRSILLLHSLLIIMMLHNSLGHVTALGDAAVPAPEGSREKANTSSTSAPTVNLRTAIGETILFRAQNDEEENNAAPQDREIPHLVLNRNGVLTPGYKRTLVVSVSNLAVPSSGMYVQLTIETQHGDPDLGGGEKNTLQIWRETNFVPYTALTQEGVSANFNITFDRFTKLQNKMILTPTDYYRYRVVVSDPSGNILREISEDYAFLMENQWRVPLPNVLEASPNAAPEALLIYFYDMIPFQTNLRDPYTQIPRQEVQRYIQTELIPAMVEAFRIQSDLWELPWYREWFNYRSEEDPKTLSVALGEHRVWFHGEAPSLGHAMISIRVDGSVGEYERLTDGIMSIFHHELFHNHQRNISLHFGSQGFIAGKEKAWQVFSEGTAVLASSVGQPNVEFEQTKGLRSYLKRANAFIGSEGTYGGGLNKSYKKIPYQTAIYWRFLYEKCGGLDSGQENPAAGMRVIRIALETLYKGEIVDINSSTDVAGSLPRIMDHALANTPSCPFESYEESLAHFARAIYMLRLEDGRCNTLDNSQECGFYDPHGLYPTPPVESISSLMPPITSATGNIPASYGIDFMQVMPGSPAEGKSLKIVFDSAHTSDFNIEVWKIRNLENDDVTSERFPFADDSVSSRTKNGHLMIGINNMNEFDRLALIITRMDPNEEEDGMGSYEIHFLLE